MGNSPKLSLKFPLLFVISLFAILLLGLELEIHLNPSKSLDVSITKLKDYNVESSFEAYSFPELLEGRELYESYVYEICESYNISPYLIISVIERESRFIPDVSNGNHVGLMQVSTYWHKDRAESLGVTDLYDPYSNILTGVDYFSDLINNYADGNIEYALMLYSMDNNKARQMYNNGQLSGYAKSVLARMNELEVNSRAKEET